MRIIPINYKTMKKTIFLLSAIILMGGSALAQKKNVSKAKAKILSETPDTKAAKEAILLALKDSTTDKLASTWFLAGDVFNAIYTEQQKKQWTEKKGDQAMMAESVAAAFNYYTVADSLDQLPNAKGKIAPKYHNKVVDKIKALQRGFTEGGSYYYEQKDYKKALNMFGTYVNYQNLPLMKGQGLEKDTLIPLITYYCGLCATQAELPAVAIKYYEQVKDQMDSKWIYARLCDDYTSLKDTANMIRMFKLGAQKFPSESFYVRSLINYYINQSKMDEALTWINQALALDEKSAILWNVKGRILENSKDIEGSKGCYQKAIDLDPNFADALGNMGRLYYNHAVEELDRINAIKDDKKYRAEKAKLKPMFETPRPYFEKAMAISPEERDYVIALRGIYYNLGMDAKYKEMDQKLKGM
jgi:tetratricopeptide (TPR) repeat protein